MSWLWKFNQIFIFFLGESETTVLDIESDDSEDDGFYKSSSDIYIPGQYEERGHVGRSIEQIRQYRANFAFLNRIKPAHLKPTKLLNETQTALWLPGNVAKKLSRCRKGSLSQT